MFFKKQFRLIAGHSTEHALTKLIDNEHDSFDQNYTLGVFIDLSKGNKDTLLNFSFKAFHEIQFQGHFMKHEILS